MEHQKLKIIHGLEIFLGQIYKTETLKLLSFLLKKKISTKKT
jgi:hypothetical protein